MHELRGMLPQRPSTPLRSAQDDVREALRSAQDDVAERYAV